MGRFLLARLRESSTWRGLVYLAAGLAGVDVSDDDAEAIVAGAMALSGLLAVAVPDRIGQ